MLSEIVEKEFGGKLWSCSTCLEKGVMKGNTSRRKWKDSHKKTACALFLEDLLPASKNSWGKAINNGDPTYVYGKPKVFRDILKKKVPPPSSTDAPHTESMLR